MILTSYFSRLSAISDELPKKWTPQDFPENPRQLKKVKDLGGSTGAILVQGGDGKLYVLKKGNSPEHLREENYADSAYRSLGVPVPHSKLYEDEESPVKLSEFHHGMSLFDLKRSNPEGFQKAIKDLQKHFVADALLGNWDVLGMHLDNVLATQDGHILRIDNGGSLRYRAQGAPKSKSAWTSIVSELNSLRDPNVNRNTAAIFGGIPDSEIKRQIHEIVSKKDQLLRSVPEDLRQTLFERINYLAAHANELRDVSSSRVSSSRPDPEMSADLADEIYEVMHRINQETKGGVSAGGDIKVLLNTRTHEVWVSSGDWHEGEVVRAVTEALEGLEGVTGVDGESESYPEGYNYGQGESDWEEVYPETPQWAIHYRKSSLLSF